MLTLAHLSDIHLPPLPGYSLSQLTPKQLLGLLNWYRKRKFIHRAEILQEIVDDVKQTAPHHIAITGDMTNLGLTQEFETARNWIEQLEPDTTKLTLIPGNHDAYAGKWEIACAKNWDGFMPLPVATEITQHFPFVRKLDQNVALIGLCSGVKTPPFMAWGVLGNEQLDRLHATLKELRTENQCRIILIHHPPLPDMSAPRRALKDARALQEVIEDAGAELVLYGHNHKWATDRLNTKTGEAVCLQVPSASQGHYKNYALAGYNLFHIMRTNTGWQIDLSQRGLQTEQSQIATLARQTFNISR